MKEGSYYPGTDQDAEGSAVFINNKTGGVEAAIGGRDYTAKGYNRVTAVRQPGQRLSRWPYTDLRCRKRNLSRTLC